MDIKRLMTGLLGFPIVVLIFVFGNKYVVDVVCAIIAALSLHEYFNAMKAKSKPVIWIGYVMATLIAFIHVFPIEHAITIISILIPITVTTLFMQIVLTNMKTNIVDIAVTFFGICYIPLFFMFVPLLHGMENGKILIWFIIIISWGTDTLAYCVGKLIGKHKFSKISPNKTIEGCIGGIVGAVILTLVYTYMCNTIWSMNLSYLTIAIVAIILSMVSQIGDFAASSIKRYVGIKDFSNLIPGHGGMLDRIDSVIFVAPFVYILFAIILK